MSEHLETVVVGAGQAGLATGYHLSRRGRPFVILDEHDRVGDNWRSNWDSLRLYSPASHDCLPGMPFPGDQRRFPTKDDMADYLEAYATRFDLPVRGGVRVHRLEAVPDGYRLTTDTGVLTCDNVVVATGSFGRTPYLPSCAADLDPGILQMHSSEYRRPSQLRAGPALVVGASHSGADIAYEIGAHHPTVLCGPVRGEIPFRLESRVAQVLLPVMFTVASHLLTIRTPLGRKLRPEVRKHGGPLLRVKMRDLQDVGVEHDEAKVVGVRDGMPVLDGGRRVEVANVIWCTGFQQRFEWIDLPVLAEDGWPEENRGVVDAYPGLYFTGLAFQFGFTSMLVGGSSRDARYVAEHIASRAAKARPLPLPKAS